MEMRNTLVDVAKDFGLVDIKKRLRKDADFVKILSTIVRDSLPASWLYTNALFSLKPDGRVTVLRRNLKSKAATLVISYFSLKPLRKGEKVAPALALLRGSIFVHDLKEGTSVSTIVLCIQHALPMSDFL